MTPSEEPRHVPPGQASRRLHQAGLAFDTQVLEQLLQRDPENLDLMAALAEACTRARRYRRGLALDRELVGRAPREPVYRYNLACSLSLTGDVAEAATQLLAAIELGYRDFEALRADPDLRRLRAAPAWSAVAARMKELADENRA